MGGILFLVVGAASRRLPRRPLLGAIGRAEAEVERLFAEEMARAPASEEVGQRVQPAKIMGEQGNNNGAYERQNMLLRHNKRANTSTMLIMVDKQHSKRGGRGGALLSLSTIALGFCSWLLPSAFDHCRTSQMCNIKKPSAQRAM